jgi:toxin ParE1/3/4
LRQWNEQQWEAYEAALLRVIGVISENPFLGRARDDLRPGARAFPVEQHIIFYEVFEEAVRIARILHRRMDARRALEGS